MKALFVIARHEISRRWVLFFVGLALGAIPMMVQGPELVWPPPEGDLRDTLLLIGAVVSWVIAFATGMSLVGRPLHDNRLSFYFTRPIAARSIALGKVLGGVVVIAGMESLLSMSVFSDYEWVEYANRDFETWWQFEFVQRNVLVESKTGWQLAQGSLGIGLAFLAVGLVVGVVARSRARWFVVDLIGGLLATLAGILMFGSLGTRKTEIASNVDDFDAAMALIHRADLLLYVTIVIAGIVLPASVIAAVAIGRTDRDRVHRALSFTLWPALTMTALIGIACVQWGLR